MFTGELSLSHFGCSLNPLPVCGHPCSGAWEQRYPDALPDATNDVGASRKRTWVYQVTVKFHDHLVMLNH